MGLPSSQYSILIYGATLGQIGRFLRRIDIKKLFFHPATKIRQALPSAKGHLGLRSVPGAYLILCICVTLAKWIEQFESYVRSISRWFGEIHPLPLGNFLKWLKLFF